MNERIKELIEQATDSISYRVCQNTYKEVDDPAGPFVRKEFNKEKFAELIVWECANLASEETSLPYNSYSEKIKKHFGVE